MIPKIIHYCWLSDDPVPADLQHYMESWKKYLPDYEFIHWSFKNFDKSSSMWVSQAFDSKKYAFAADYIRLYALYNYGGFYLDMDVEILKPYAELLNLGTVLGYENSTDGRLEVAAFGVEKGSKWVKDCLDYYDSKNFINDNGSFNTKVLPLVIRDVLAESGFECLPVKNYSEALSIREEKVIPVFPFDYFSPKSHGTGNIQSSKNTYSIHHFAGSWFPWYTKWEKAICEALGIRFRFVIERHIINRFKHSK